MIQTLILLHSLVMIWDIIQYNMNLDDDNFDEDNPASIVFVRLIS